MDRPGDADSGQNIGRKSGWLDGPTGRRIGADSDYIRVVGSGRALPISRKGCTRVAMPGDRREDTVRRPTERERPGSR
jgi:hypothetical protein